jgi:hypothetical protein
MMFTTGIAHRIDHHLLKPARRKISATGARTIGEMIATMTVPRSQLKRLNEPISGSLSLSHDKRTVTTRFPIFDHPHHVNEIWNFSQAPPPNGIEDSFRFTYSSAKKNSTLSIVSISVAKPMPRAVPASSRRVGSPRKLLLNDLKIDSIAAKSVRV